METLLNLVIFAILVQFVVDVIKNILPEVILKYIRPPLLAIFFSIPLAIQFGLDVFSMLGFEGTSAITTQVFTGLIISAGAVPVHELIAKLRESREVNVHEERIGLTKRR